jgi:SnoaL-like domain
MSEENVEVVRRWFEEFRNPKEIRARVAELWEPDGDYYPVRGFPEARPCHGHEEIAAFLSEYLAAWETYAYTVADAIAVGDDRVLIHGDIHGRDGRAAWCSRATPITAFGSGMAGSSGRRTI